ncbi:MAG: precorrin-6y C5,15-methyltransferase (decarboxylating) subunit CbiE, partial [Dethiobacteria bacterium]
MNKIKVLAVGPGSPDYLPPVIAAQVEQCDLLVGGRRNLALFDIPGQEKIEITGKLDPVSEAIRSKSQERRVGVLVSGDTGIY